jgi:hypothetical protein
MDASEREELVAKLDQAFGGATDVTPSPDHALHVLLTNLELAEPWKPSPTRALAIFGNWPTDRPLFFVDEAVVGETGQPPESHHSGYHLDESWRGFSWTFAWNGNDPVRAIQLWLNRFIKKPT